MMSHTESPTNVGEVTKAGYKDGVTVLTLLGEHDMATAAELLRKITEQAERGCGLVVSLSEAEFIGSHIVHTMVKGDQLLREQHRRLVLHVGTPRIVERILELSGLLDELIWSDALDKAVALAERQL